jgi:hypothetical protein
MLHHAHEIAKPLMMMQGASPHLMQVASAYHMLVKSETTTFKVYDPTPCITMLLM